MNFYPVCRIAEHRDRHHHRMYNCNQNGHKPGYGHVRQGYNFHHSQPHHHHHHHQHHHFPVFHGINNFPHVFIFAPQQSQQSCFERGILRLNKEVETLYGQLRPSGADHRARKKLISQIQDAVQGKWQSAKVDVFGSVRTDLSLPTSDIDLVVLNAGWQRPPFQELKDELIAHDICDKDKVIVLDNASVPIIKLTDKQNSIKVDIGFNIANALESANLTEEYITRFSALPYLVVVLKQFLVEHELNEVYTGGLSSYGLILMVISFLKRFCRPESKDYGRLLLHFLHYFAFEFDYSTAIDITSPTGFGRRSDNRGLLSIRDPLCSSNDVARGSYRYHYIRSMLQDAHNRLFRCLETNVVSRECPILAEIITVPSLLQCCRRAHCNNGGVGTSGSNADSMSSGSSDASSGLSGDADSDSEVQPRTSNSANGAIETGCSNPCAELLKLSNGVQKSSSCNELLQPKSRPTPSDRDAVSRNRNSFEGSQKADVVADQLVRLKLKDSDRSLLSDAVVACDSNNNSADCIGEQCGVAEAQRTASDVTEKCRRINVLVS